MTISRITSSVVAMAVVLSASLATSGSARADTEVAAPGSPSRGTAPARFVASGLGASTGSSVGPDGDIYVVDGAAGVVRRVDARTGRTSTFATGLPRPVGSYGGAVDVAFVGLTTYVLVTLVSADVGGVDVDGIYRLNAGGGATLVADIGA
jgi:hypothetical protein